MPPPERTAEQRAAALAKAAEARRVRAEIKALISTGTLSVSDVLGRGDEDDLVGGMKVRSVLVSVPRFGKVKTKRFLADNRIAENRRLRSLTERQRAVLVDAFS